MADSGSQPQRSRGGMKPARVLAPLALVGLVIAMALVVSSSLGDDADPSANTGATTERARNGSDGGEPTPREYVVESGDSLSTIAERFDISVERIQRLNPDVDPQTLGEGQTLQLRKGGGGSD